MTNSSRLYFALHKPFLLLLNFIFVIILTFSTVLFAADEPDLVRVMPHVRAIGAIVSDSKVHPTCFISRCYTGEDPQILSAQATIDRFLREIGIRTIFDVNGGFGGLPVGGGIDSFMERGIGTRGNFVLCLFTPSGLEQSRVRGSGFATELRLIHERLGRDGPYFFVPVLMAGNEHTVAGFNRLFPTRPLFARAINPATGRFDLTTFCKEIWHLFDERFFRHIFMFELRTVLPHPRLSEIQRLLREGGEVLGLHSAPIPLEIASSAICECSRQLPIPVTTAGERNARLYSAAHGGRCQGCGMPLR